jgi:hypothetical protein
MMIQEHESESAFNPSSGHIAKSLDEEVPAGAFVDPVLQNQVV